MAARQRSLLYVDLNYALTATGAVSTEEAATAPAMDAKLMGAFLGSGSGEAVVAGVAEAEGLRETSTVSESLSDSMVTLCSFNQYVNPALE